MKWWKRLILSIISLGWGFVSLDYLYLAFCYLTLRNSPEFLKAWHLMADKVSWQALLCEVLGGGMLVLWGLILVFYIWLIRRMSPKADIIEKDPSGREIPWHKWLDVVFQLAMLVTGVILRWAYLCLFYFPTMR